MKVFAVIIVIFALLGGFIFIPFADPGYEISTDDGGRVFLLSDDMHSLEFVVQSRCSDQFQMQLVPSAEDEIARYNVAVTTAENTYEDWFHYSLYDKEYYDNIDPLTLPGKPAFSATDGEKTLAYWTPLEAPLYIGHCGINGIEPTFLNSTL